MLLFVIIFLVSGFSITLSELFLNVYGGLSSRFSDCITLPACSFPFFRIPQAAKVNICKKSRRKTSAGKMKFRDYP